MTKKAAKGAVGLTARQSRFVDEYLIDANRFAARLDTSGGDDACWGFTGAKDDQGYGRFHVGKTRNSSMLAHRVAFGIEHGYLPEAVCHKCDNPECCNPAHLFGGSRADNNRDMLAKGRHWTSVDPSRAAKGEGHGSAKLSDGAIKDIRRLHASEAYSQRALASEFGVSQRTINKVVRNIGWRHVK